MIALALKMYTSFNEDKTITTRCKGFKMDGKLQYYDYNEIILKKNVKEGQNHNLQLRNGVMSNVSIKRTFSQQVTQSIKSLQTSRHAFLWDIQNSNKNNECRCFKV
jgi:hypothetical protein